MIAIRCITTNASAAAYSSMRAARQSTSAASRSMATRCPHTFILLAALLPSPSYLLFSRLPPCPAIFTPSILLPSSCLLVRLPALLPIASGLLMALKVICQSHAHRLPNACRLPIACQSPIVNRMPIACRLSTACPSPAPPSRILTSVGFAPRPSQLLSVGRNGALACSLLRRCMPSRPHRIRH